MVPRALMVGVALVCCGCGPLPFSAEVKGEGVVSGSPLGALLSAFPSLGGLSAFDFNENQDFKNNGATRDNVASVKVESFTLRIVEPADQDFSFLDSAQMVAKSSDAETVVAEKNGIAQTASSPPNAAVNFDILNPEIVQHLNAPTMSIVLRGKGYQPPRDTRIEAKAKLKVYWKL